MCFDEKENVSNNNNYHQFYHMPTTIIRKFLPTNMSSVVIKPPGVPEDDEEWLYGGIIVWVSFSYADWKKSTVTNLSDSVACK